MVRIFGVGKVKNGRVIGDGNLDRLPTFDAQQLPVKQQLNLLEQSKLWALLDDGELEK
jgi:hypothetical protein